MRDDPRVNLYAGRNRKISPEILSLKANAK